MKIDPSIFKAYDIRGIYPDNINEEIAYKIAQGYVDLVKPKKPIVIGHDVRTHSEELKKSMISGLTDAGIDVVDIGLISTEMIYFATGNYGYGGGIQVTASHDSSEYHGFKLVRENVIPISGVSGIEDIKDFVLSDKKIVSDNKGKVEIKEILIDYCNYLLNFIDKKSIKSLKIVANPNFGFEGRILKKLIEMGSLPFEIISINAEPDGTFPKGRPDPFVPENRTETIDLVKKEKADFGVMWDADADRVFFVDDNGLFVDSYFINSILISDILKKFPGQKIVYDPRYTWALIEATKEAGSVAVMERVGHSFIKARMRKENAIFSGESSGHTYYREFWYADCGMLPLLQVIEIVSKEAKKLSKIIEPVRRKYFISGEINYKTPNADNILKVAEEKYKSGIIDRTDILSIEFTDWRFNMRTSNTGEKFLRLNLEAKSESLKNEKEEELDKLIKNLQ